MSYTPIPSRNEDSPHTDGDTGVPILAVRRDADNSAVSADGDYASLLVNSEGRLKTAGAPAQFLPVTGAITAIQAVVNTPVASATVFADVTQVSNVMAYVTGTFVAMNVTFEGSLDSTNGTDGSWFTIQAVRSSTNTIESATGSLSAAPTYAWELSVNALIFFRVRCTARTSGTQNWRFILGSYATEPIPAAQVTTTQPVSGSVSVSGTAVTTPATPTALNFNSAATTNATIVKSTAGTLYSIYVSNSNAAARYLKLYNKATAPVVGTDVPIIVIPIPATDSVILTFGSMGHRFLLGIGLATTTGMIDTDTTAVAVSEIKAVVQYI